VPCSLLQSVAVLCGALQLVAVRFGCEEGNTVCCSALQFVAAWCVAACLQCDAAGFGVSGGPRSNHVTVESRSRREKGDGGIKNESCIQKLVMSHINCGHVCDMSHS